MKVHVVKPRDLSADQVSLWRRFQDLDSALVSPYLCPEFTQAVGEVRDDAFVGVMEDAGEVIGFFPFQRRLLGVGKPIGGPLSDYQGVIAHPEVPWDGADLVRQCGLSVYDFDHMLASQDGFVPYHAERIYSPTMDLSQGFPAYAEGRRRVKSKVLKDNGRLTRKLAREVGPLRFTLHDNTPEAFSTLLTWKRDQYRRTGAYDVFQHSWTLDLLQRLCAIQADGFAGLLSSLYADDQLVSVHLGMRSRRVWHQWFPAHDPALLRYSPGMMLQLMMAEEAPSLGIWTIDMGWGDDLLKQRLCDGAVPIAVGRVEHASPVAGFRRVRRATEGLFQGLPLGPLSAVPRKVFNRIERHMKFM